jgi:hypothetical protein
MLELYHSTATTIGLYLFAIPINANLNVTLSVRIFLLIEDHVKLRNRQWIRFVVISDETTWKVCLVIVHMGYENFMMFFSSLTLSIKDESWVADGMKEMETGTWNRGRNSSKSGMEL